MPWVGAEEWVTQVSNDRGWANNVAWQPWTVDSQVAGYVSQWSEIGFTFATVYGAGHMVPETRPEAAGALFSRFISGDNEALISGLVRETQQPLTITRQPASVVVRANQTFSLKVELSGGQPPYALTWTKDSRPLSATWEQAAYRLDGEYKRGILYSKRGNLYFE